MMHIRAWISFTVVTACFYDPTGSVTRETDVSNNTHLTTMGTSAGDPTTGQSIPPPTASDSNPTTGSSTTASTEPSGCGDGVVGEGEECDDGDQDNSDACTNACTLAYCGDSVVGPGETCDDGNQVNEDGCDNTCVLSSCGDGILQAGEECDAGGESQVCNSNCTPPVCGDAILNHTASEDCDGGGETPTCNADCSISACGDGIFNASADEACDDSNTQDGDGCSGDCQDIERRVFVSSKTYRGDFDPATNNPNALSGIPLADYRCQFLAQIASIPGIYKAWLSDGAASPATRFDTRFTGLYRLTSEGFPVVAHGWPDLTDGSLSHAIDSNASGILNDKGATVWTNTSTEGDSASDQHCNGWTSVSNQMTTTVGRADLTDNRWTEQNGGADCSNPFVFYCFEDP